ncbi:MAG: hypothetical protein KBT47_02290 [Armatimonadetes bacterium]|nr:hypothetical protein [Candidatus Hippobium faecium]
MNRLYAGFGEADITCPVGIHLSGKEVTHKRPAMTIKDRLYAKASAFKTGDTKICLVGMDLASVTENKADLIKTAVSQKYSMDKEAISVFVMQSHSAPGLGHFMLDEDLPLDLPEDKEFVRGSEKAYDEIAVNGAIKACCEALDSLQPVSMGIGRGMAPRLAFNRRVIDRNGKCIMPFPPDNSAISHPVGPVQFLYDEGPADNEVGVALFRDEEMNIVGALNSFACHPVNLFCSFQYNCISPDWPGVWSEMMKKSLRMKNLPLVLNGCCGNINPIDPWTQDYKLDEYVMSEKLNYVSDRIAYSMLFDEVAEPIKFREIHIPLPYREIPEERLREAREKFASVNNIEDHLDEDWFFAASTLSCYYEKQRNGNFDFVVNIFKIGKLAIVTMPGEPFIEAQLEIKEKAKADFVFVTHCANKYLGYLPKKSAFQHGGHSCNDLYTYWAKMAEGNMEIVIDRVINELNDMF